MRWPLASKPWLRPLPPRHRPRPRIALPPPPESGWQFSPRRNKNRAWRFVFRQSNRELTKDAGLSVLFQPVIRSRIFRLQFLQFVADALPLQPKVRYFLAPLSPG